MVSSGVSGFGTLLIWNYNRILEMMSIGGPAQTRDTIDVTSHDSPDNYREFVAGPASGGEVSIDGNLIVEDELGQVAFYANMLSGTKRTAWIVMPMAVGASLLFEAIAKSFSLSAPHDDKIGVSAALQITGKPTLYVAQSAGMTVLTGKKYGGVDAGAALVITPAVAVDTYAYGCTVDADTTGVLLTATAVGHIVRIQGVLEGTGVETPVAITLNPAGEDTEVFIMVYETPTVKSPRLYVLTVTRPA